MILSFPREKKNHFECILLKKNLIYSNAFSNLMK